MIPSANPSLHPAALPALPDERAEARYWFAAAVLALLVSGIPAIWPGDGVWLWDEPEEFARALQANQEHRLADHGLSGSFPVPFGALGIHLYQFWLVFTHNPRTLVVLHALTCTVPTAIALLWLARALRLNPWFAAAVLAGPHIWFEARRLWQPTFCVPLGCMALAAYASFVRGRSRGSLLLAITCAIAPLLIHLQAIPLSAAILGHLILWHRAELRRHQLAIAGVVVGFATLQGAYVVGAFFMILRQCVGFIRTGHNSNTPLAQACLGPFLSGRLFSGWDWMGPGLAEKILGVLASIAMVLVWMGIALAAWMFISRWRNPAEVETPADGQEMSLGGVRGTMLSVCAAGVGIHLAMCITARLGTVHHYFFGTFGMYVLLAWLALDALPRWWIRAGIIAVYGLASMVMTGGLILRTHANGWMLTGLLPSIGEQVTLVRQLDRYSDEMAYTEVPNYMERPFVLWYLRQLMGSSSRPEDRVYSGRLFIRFRRDAEGKPTNRIELVETETAPAGAKLIWVVPAR